VADITYTLAIRVAKDNFANSIQVSSVTANMNVAGGSSVVLPLSATTVSISTATLSSVGLAYLQNLSTDTATITTARVGVVSGGTFYPFSTLLPGEVGVIRLAAGSQFAAQGATAARLRVDILEG